jgi:hypothetical protein
MKATYFNMPLEWNIETVGESWKQGETLKGTLKVKNHGNETHALLEAGVGLAHAEIKKVHARAEGALKILEKIVINQTELAAGAEAQMEFSFVISSNGAITDKKSSYYLSFGQNFCEGQLQVKVVPKLLYSKIVGLLDTFHRFKQKELKAAKSGVEYKLFPPTSRDMANIDSLLLTLSMQEENLNLKFNFQVKRLDTSSVTTKINKESVAIEKSLLPKEYSLGGDLINQDHLLKTLEAVISDVKIKAVF